MPVAIRGVVCGASMSYYVCCNIIDSTAEGSSRLEEGYFTSTALVYEKRPV